MSLNQSLITDLSEYVRWSQRTKNENPFRNCLIYFPAANKEMNKTAINQTNLIGIVDIEVNLSSSVFAT